MKSRMYKYAGIALNYEDVPRGTEKARGMIRRMRNEKPRAKFEYINGAWEATKRPTLPMDAIGGNVWEGKGLMHAWQDEIEQRPKPGEKFNHAGDAMEYLLRNSKECDGDPAATIKEVYIVGMRGGKELAMRTDEFKRKEFEGTIKGDVYQCPKNLPPIDFTKCPGL